MTGGEHEDRGGVARGPDPACDLQTSDARHHDVEDDDVGPSVPDQREARRPVRGGVHLVPLELEGTGERLADPAVVLDEQQPWPGHPPGG